MLQELILVIGGPDVAEGHDHWLVGCTCLGKAVAVQGTMLVPELGLQEQCGKDKTLGFIFFRVERLGLRVPACVAAERRTLASIRCARGGRPWA